MKNWGEEVGSFQMSRGGSCGRLVIGMTGTGQEYDLQLVSTAFAPMCALDGCDQHTVVEMRHARMERLSQFCFRCSLGILSSWELEERSDSEIRL